MNGRLPSAPGCQPSASAADAGWQGIGSAPRDGSTFFAETFDGFRLLVRWEWGFINSDEEDCGSWVAAIEDVHPEDWTDGVCWESNEDGIHSDPPLRWIDPNGIAASVANRCGWKERTDNYARVYQGAYLGALRAFEALASAMSAGTAETPQGAQGEARQRGAAKTADAQPQSSNPPEQQP